MISHIWNLKKMIQMNLYTKQKQTHKRRKQMYGDQSGEGEEGQIRSIGLAGVNYNT